MSFHFFEFPFFGFCSWCPLSVPITADLHSVKRVHRTTWGAPRLKASPSRFLSFSATINIERKKKICACVDSTKVREIVYLAVQSFAESFFWLLFFSVAHLPPPPREGNCLSAFLIAAKIHWSYGQMQKSEIHQADTKGKIEESSHQCCRPMKYRNHEISEEFRYFMQEILEPGSFFQTFGHRIKRFMQVYILIWGHKSFSTSDSLLTKHFRLQFPYFLHEISE